jgi:hypothetical protein
MRTLTNLIFNKLGSRVKRDYRKLMANPFCISAASVMRLQIYRTDWPTAARVCSICHEAADIQNGLAISCRPVQLMANPFCTSAAS